MDRIVAAYYRGRAEHFRKLAQRASDPKEAELYAELAREFDDKSNSRDGLTSSAVLRA
jgi:hypothetical protein